MATHGHTGPIPLHRWVRRTPMFVLSALFAASGVALVALSAVGYFSSSETPATAPIADARSLAIQPEHIYDRPVFQPTPSPTPNPTRSPQPTAKPTPGPPPLGNGGFAIVIPGIGVEAPVNTYGLDANLAPEVPLNGYEVAWYNWSAPPGTGGNAVLAGHVTWQGAAVFYNLDQLQPGDRIVLRSAQGTELAYTIEENLLVDPHDPDALALMGQTDDDMLTVITCGGDFFYSAAAPFGGDYTDRRVVRASLDSSTGAAAASIGR